MPFGPATALVAHHYQPNFPAPGERERENPGLLKSALRTAFGGNKNRGAQQAQRAPGVYPARYPASGYLRRPAVYASPRFARRYLPGYRAPVDPRFIPVRRVPAMPERLPAGRPQTLPPEVAREIGALRQEMSMQREELAAARRERVVNQRQWAAYWNAQAAQEAEMRRAMAKPTESGGQRLKKVLFGDLANDQRRL